MESRFHWGGGQAGFTLVELAVVVVVIGVLAAFAVPRFMSSVERSRAAEAANYLSTVHSAQERYQARQGTFADDLRKLDTALTEPEYFSVGAVTVPASESNLETGWQLALTRDGASSGYGAYTIVFNQDGFDRQNSTVPDEITPFESVDN